MATIYFNLFLRNWLNHRANEPEIDAAVTKGFLTPQEAQTIKDTER